MSAALPGPGGTGWTLPDLEVILVWLSAVSIESLEDVKKMVMSELAVEC